MNNLSTRISALCTGSGWVIHCAGRKCASMPILGIVAMLVAQNFYGSLPIDGVDCNPTEGAAEHIHSQLQLYDRGKRITVPANIGMSQTAGCLYWIHTHDSNGYIHIESPVIKNYTLGQFFDIWGRQLSWTHAAGVAASHGNRLSIWVNGKSWHGKRSSHDRFARPREHRHPERAAVRETGSGRLEKPLTRACRAPWRNGRTQRPQLVARIHRSRCRRGSRSNRRFGAGRRRSSARVRRRAICQRRSDLRRDDRLRPAGATCRSTRVTPPNCN